MDNTPINQHLKNMSIKLQMLMFPFEAESTAFWVAGMLGLDTGDYSFGYITGWSKDREVSELKENLELIKNTANELVTKIDEKLAELETKQEMPEESETQIPVKKKSR